MSQTQPAPQRQKDLRKLAEMMNSRHRNALPITQPLLDCFDAAVAPVELQYLLSFGTETRTFSQAAQLAGRREDEFRPFFTSLLKKGFLLPQGGDQGERYSLNGIMLGWFEFYLCDGQETPEQREFARRLDKLFKSWGSYNVFPLRNLLNFRFKRRSVPFVSVAAATGASSTPSERTVAIDRKVPASPPRVYPARTVNDLIEKHGDNQSIALVHCFCRQYHKMIDEPCRLGIQGESCMVIGSLSHHAERSGFGRKISKEEALSLVQELQSKGAVHQVFHENEDVNQPEIAICNCCWDCCGMFGSYNRGILPLHFRCYFEARIQDASVCSGCATCVDHCPVQAITLAGEKSRIESSKCIGCGQCELHCPEGAIRLEPSERDIILPLVKRSEARISS